MRRNLGNRWPAKTQQKKTVKKATGIERLSVTHQSHHQPLDAGEASAGISVRLAVMKATSQNQGASDEGLRVRKACVRFRSDLVHHLRRSLFGKPTDPIFRASHPRDANLHPTTVNLLQLLTGSSLQSRCNVGDSARRAQAEIKKKTQPPRGQKAVAPSRVYLT